MYTVPVPGLTAHAVAGRGLSEGLGRTRDAAQCLAPREARLLPRREPLYRPESKPEDHRDAGHHDPKLEFGASVVRSEPREEYEQEGH
jgi:hypothetical protein